MRSGVWMVPKRERAVVLESVDDVEIHPESEVFATGKGGVGKSTTAAHQAAYYAKNGLRTLLVCVTGQEDDDLGVSQGRGTPPPGDSVMAGHGLYDAIDRGMPLNPVTDVRPGLDVVPGGLKVGKIPTLLTMRMMEEGPACMQSLALSMQPLIHLYDRVVFDSAPENDTLEQLVLGAARRMFTPTRSDSSSINGLRRIAGNWRIVRQRGINRQVEVAGAFLYGSNPSATSLHQQVKGKVEEILGDSTPILSTVVGYREKPAVNARTKGLLFWEYADLLPHSARSYDVAAGRAKEEDVVPEAALPLAKDMQALNEEIASYSGGLK
ncbi:ParA family protein [Streptomyces xiamenensis]|uniref:ParA family protein n=1 Tax=Streptomyces xiamenensis TaxID=408015 RepID=UPI0035D865FC